MWLTILLLLKIKLNKKYSYFYSYFIIFAEIPEPSKIYVFCILNGDSLRKSALNYLISPANKRSPITKKALNIPWKVCTPRKVFL